MKWLLLLITMLFIAILLVLYQKRGANVEKFLDITDDSVTTQNLAVYFTDNLEACDRPGVKKIISSFDEELNYDYHEEYYKRVLALCEQLSPWFPFLYELMYKLRDIVQDYQKFPQNQYCKVAIPNWKIMRKQNENVFYGNISQNKERLDPSDWAFALLPEPDDEDDDIPDENGLIMDKDENGEYIHVTIGDQKYVRGRFPDFSKETVAKLYCSVAKDASYTPKYGFRIDIDTGIVKLTNGFTVIDDPDQETVLRFLKPIFVEEKGIQPSKDDKYKFEYVVSKEARVQYPVVRYKKDVCDHVIKALVPDMFVSVRFKNVVELKRILYSQGNSYLLGTETELDENIRVAQNRGTELSQAIAERYNAYTQATDNYNQTLGQVNGLQNQLNRLNHDIGAKRRALPWAFLNPSRQRTLRRQIAAEQSQSQQMSMQLKQLQAQLSVAKNEMDTAQADLNMQSSRFDINSSQINQIYDLKTKMDNVLYQFILSELQNDNITLVPSEWNNLLWWKYASFDKYLYIEFDGQ